MVTDMHAHDAEPHGEMRTVHRVTHSVLVEVPEGADAGEPIRAAYALWAVPEPHTQEFHNEMARRQSRVTIEHSVNGHEPGCASGPDGPYSSILSCCRGVPDIGSPQGSTNG